MHLHNDPTYITAHKIRRKIKLIEGNAKCRHLKKLTCEWTLRQCLSVLGTEPNTPPPPKHWIRE
jgi:hypothetical protein